MYEIMYEIALPHTPIIQVKQIRRLQVYAAQIAEIKDCFFNYYPIFMKVQEFQGLKNGSYFYITNRQTKQALAYNIDEPHPKLAFHQFKDSCPNQIWMIQQVQQNKYQIVHAYSTLVLSATRKSAKLNPGNQQSSQLFFVQKSNPKENPLQYWIKENKTSDRLLFFDIALRCDVVNPKASKARWQLKRIGANNELLKSCLLQFAYSGLYLDVPGSSVKPGVKICQYSLNARCNQRWKVVKNSDNKYMFISVRSQKCLTISKQKQRVGTQIVQLDIQNECKAQLWKLHHQGANLYIIESDLAPNLFMGIRNNSMDQNAIVVTTNQEQYAFWRIIGDIQQ